jgi:hypothetical protein
VDRPNNAESPPMNSLTRGLSVGASMNLSNVSLASSTSESRIEASWG